MPNFSNQPPFEIIAAPFEVWWAPVGTAFPALEDDPAMPWEMIGTNGCRNLSEDGVTITMNQTINDYRGLCSTGPVKSFRTEEELMVGFTLVDVSSTGFRLNLNQNQITDTPAGVGTFGYKQIGLSRGPLVQQIALMIRGPSAELEDGIMQFELPRVYEGGSSPVQFQKGEPAGLSIEFHAMEDLDATDESERFGRLLIADADPTS